MKSSLRARTARRLSAAALAAAVVVPLSAGVAAASSKSDPVPQRSATYSNAADDSSAFIPPNLIPMIWAYCMSLPFPVDEPVCQGLFGDEGSESIGSVVLKR